MERLERALGCERSSTLLEQLEKALKDVNGAVVTKNESNDLVDWVQIKEHFHKVEEDLKRQAEELDSRQKQYDAKEAEVHAKIKDKESSVYAKEQALLDRVQELKDAAVSAIVGARTSHEANAETDDGNVNKPNGFLGDIDSPEDDSPMADYSHELTQLCEQADAKGLVSFITENQKNLRAIREELSVALESASEPACFVLEVLKGLHETPSAESTAPAVASALRGVHKSCVALVEAFSALTARIDPSADHILNQELKQQAKAIADEWKPELDTDAPNGGESLEAEAFLQLVASYRIASEFDEEELCKLVLLIAHLHRAPQLCRSLGLASKVPGLVESLSRSGRAVDAVRFICNFDLMKSFDPVPMLKQYLKDLRRNSQAKNSVRGYDEKVDANAQELAAIKVVIRCVEECKLENQYPVDTLRRRAAQLKPKCDKKRVYEFLSILNSKKG